MTIRERIYCLLRPLSLSEATLQMLLSDLESICLSEKAKVQAELDTLRARVWQPDWQLPDQPGRRRARK